MNEELLKQVKKVCLEQAERLAVHKCLEYLEKFDEVGAVEFFELFDVYKKAKKAPSSWFPNEFYPFICANFGEGEEEELLDNILLEVDCLEFAKKYVYERFMLFLENYRYCYEEDLAFFRRLEEK